MASIFDNIDMADPCAVWPKMQEALDRLLVGEGFVRASFGEDEVEFNRANIRELRMRIADLKAQCEAKNTPGRVRRHAIRGGFVRL